MLMLIIIPQITPIVTFNKLGENDITLANERLRLYYDVGIYEWILPYLKEHVKPGDVIVMADACQGIQYDLPYVSVVDIATSIQNLAGLRSVLIETNASKILNMISALNIRYFLLPKYPFYNGNTRRGGDVLQILVSKTVLFSMIDNNRFFKKVLSTSRWDLYEPIYVNEDFIGFTGLVLKSDALDINLMRNYTSPRDIVIGQDFILEVRADLSGMDFNWSKPIEYYIELGYEFWQNKSLVLEGNENYYAKTNVFSLNVTIDPAKILESNQYRLSPSEPFTLTIKNAKILALQGKIAYFSMLSSRESVKLLLNNQCEWTMEKGSGGLYEMTDQIMNIEWTENDFASGWVFHQATNGSTSTFETKEGILEANVSAHSQSYAFSTYAYHSMPNLSMTEHTYILCRVKGTENAHWQFRLYFSDGTKGDFPYRGAVTPNIFWSIHIFAIPPYDSGKTLRGDAYLTFISVDGLPATVQIDFYIVSKKL